MSVKNKRTKALEMRKFLLDMIADAKRECREFTEEEQKLFDDKKNELIALSEEIKATDEKLEDIKDELPEIEEMAEKSEQEMPADGPAPAKEAPAEEMPDKDPEKDSAPCDQEPCDEDDKSQKMAQINTDEEVPSPEGEKPAEEPDNEPKDDEMENKRNNTNTIMKKDFSLLKAIRCVADGKQFDELTAAVLAEGQKEFRDNGRNFSGQIQLPTEKRTITVATEHDDVVEMEWQSLIMPLFENKVLGNAKHITGLKGDVVFPYIDKTNPGASWEGEVDESAESTNTFRKIALTPHRLSTTVYVSKQFLMQESVGAEQAIRDLILESLAQKLEKTFLGKGAADNSGGKNIPAGLFHGKEATYVKDFAALCDFEAKAVENCYNLDSMKYLLDPKSWANIRGTFQYGGKQTRMVMEGDNIDGRPYDISQNFGAKEFALIDWSNVVVGEWGGIELSVDANSVGMARTAQVAITVNAWFDAKLTRDDAVLLGTVENLG